MGIARTHMVSAVARGLQAAGVTYTLPRTEDGKGDNSSAAALQRLQAVAPPNQAADGGADGGSGQNTAQAGAAAAGILLLS